MERRKIITQEIAQWRESRVLPEHYCDFLMNLYQENHDEQAAAKTASPWRLVSRTSIRDSHWKTWVVASIIILTICLLFINFKNFPFPLQISVAVTVVLISYLLGIVRMNKSKASAYALLGIGSIMMLWSGQYLLKAQGYGESAWLVGFLVFCSLVWLLMGLILNLGILQFSGWLGIVMVYGWLVHAQVAGAHWLPIQLLWLPLTLFFIWIGWLLTQRQKSVGFIYCIVGLLLWFVADAYLIFVSEHDHIWMQVLLVIKIGITIATLYAFRKKWTEWVV